MNIDMTQGKPSKVLFAFSMPLLLSALFQQFYNLADSIIAGRFIGENAMASVGASFSVTMLFMAVAFGCNAGCSVVVGRLFGAKKFRKIKTAVGTTLISFLTLAVVLTVVGSLFSRQILIAIKTPEELFENAATYLNVYVYGLCFLFLYNACNGLFTALGDSRTPLTFLIFSSLLNIVLDIVFVALLDFGVAGVAWATFITQGIAAFAALIFLLKRLGKLKIHAFVTENDTEGEYPLFSFVMLKNIAIVAIPSIVQQMVISVGNLFVQRVVNQFGQFVVAGFAAAVKLRTFAMSCFIATSNALATFSAQNLGAGKPDRVKKGFNYAVFQTWCIVVPFAIAYLVFGRFFIGLFAKDLSPEALSVGMTYLKIVAPFFFIISIKANSDAVLKGSTKMIQFMSSTMLDLVMRVLLAYVLSVPLGELGIWWAWPISWVVATALSFGFYATGIWYKPKRERKRHLLIP